MSKSPWVGHSELAWADSQQEGDSGKREGFGEEAEGLRTQQEGERGQVAQEGRQTGAGISAGTSSCPPGTKAGSAQDGVALGSAFKLHVHRSLLGALVTANSNSLGLRRAGGLAGAQVGSAAGPTSLCPEMRTNRACRARPRARGPSAVEGTSRPSLRLPLPRN